MTYERLPIMAEDVLRVIEVDHVVIISMIAIVLLARSLCRSDYNPPIARTFGLDDVQSVTNFADLMWKLTYHAVMAVAQV